MRASGGAIIAYGDDSCVFAKDGTNLTLDTVRTPRKVHGKGHEDIVESGSGHSWIVKGAGDYRRNVE